MSFNNSGAVDIQDGILSLDASGAHNNDFAIGNSATLRLNGTHTFTAAADLTGAGSLSVTGGTVTDAGSSTSVGLASPVGQRLSTIHSMAARS